ncbi:uncharacterized protein FIBRA_05866 [Fibroporia radiculosa]|uniref:F-box domain-containing protein n=1 Tax=Fibroporia radiculosa TaxID=599839 RepID=J4GRR7_9APHY|nr:uncharacterized protein FIBRA_05866 [Fibroporia radiculosa]CCM03720.1 predicted protein [Fibroporia radiculosa]
MQTIRGYAKSRSVCEPKYRGVDLRSPSPEEDPRDFWVYEPRRKGLGPPLPRIDAQDAYDSDDYLESDEDSDSVHSEYVDSEYDSSGSEASEPDQSGSDASEDTPPENTWDEQEEDVFERGDLVWISMQGKWYHGKVLKQVHSSKRPNCIMYTVFFRGNLKANLAPIDGTIKHDTPKVRRWFHSGRTTPHGDRDSDDELVGVVSMPGTPASRSRPTSRPSSPGPGGAARHARRHLQLSSTIQSARTDPLKVFPTEVSQRIFSRLSIRDLARCTRVSRKWNKSQTLNYVWFQYYRKENFHDESLPPGKWTKRESKQNWRIMHLQTIANRSQELGPIYHSYSGRSTPGGSGHQTPRELRDEKWRQEAEGETKLSKNEMREMYKELGGRKTKSKMKVGAPGGQRDKGGWTEHGSEGL